MSRNTLFAIGILAGAVLAVGACGSGSAKGAPCVEDMPGMTMCSYGVPVPASPATHAPASATAPAR